MVLLSAVSVDYKGTASDNNPRLSLSSVFNTLLNVLNASCNLGNFYQVTALNNQTNLPFRKYKISDFYLPVHLSVRLVQSGPIPLKTVYSRGDDAKRRRLIVFFNSKTMGDRQIVKNKKQIYRHGKHRRARIPHDGWWR